MAISLRNDNKIVVFQDNYLYILNTGFIKEEIIKTRFEQTIDKMFFVNENTLFLTSSFAEPLDGIIKYNISEEKIEWYQYIKEPDRYIVFSHDKKFIYFHSLAYGGISRVNKVNCENGVIEFIELPNTNNWAKHIIGCLKNDIIVADKISYCKIDFENKSVNEFIFDKDYLFLWYSTIVDEEIIYLGYGSINDFPNFKIKLLNYPNILKDAVDIKFSNSNKYYAISYDFGKTPFIGSIKCFDYRTHLCEVEINEDILDFCIDETTNCLYIEVKKKLLIYDITQNNKLVKEIEL